MTGPLELDLAELDVLAERCAALGTRYVRVMSYPNDGLAEDDWGREAIRRLRLLTARAERAGLVLLHENCSGWAGRDADRVLRLLAAVDSPALGLVFDTGNGIEYGYDAYELLAELVEAVPDRIRHVQVKDAAGTADRPDYCYPGRGPVPAGRVPAAAAGPAATTGVSRSSRTCWCGRTTGTPRPEHGDRPGRPPTASARSSSTAGGWQRWSPGPWGGGGGRGFGAGAAR